MRPAYLSTVRRAKRWGRARESHYLLAHTFLCAVVLGVVLSTPLSAFAAEASTTDAKGETGPLVHSGIMDEEHLAPLNVAWREIRTDLVRGAWQEATGRLHHLVEIRHDLGLASLPRISALLLHAADDAARNDAVDAADALANAARVLSPLLVAPRMARASYKFEQDALGIGDQIKELRSGFENLYNDLPEAMAFVGNGLTGAIYTLIVLGLFFALGMLGRYWGLLASDLRRIFPRGVTHLQAGIFLMALLCAPLLTGLGVFFTIGLWIVVSSIYQKANERLVSLLLLAGIAALPSATKTIVQTLTYPASPEAVIHRCQTGLCSKPDQARLGKFAATGVLPFQSTLTHARVLTRAAGAGASTLPDATQLATHAHALNPTPETLLLQGNISYLAALKECKAVPGQPSKASPAHAELLKEAAEFWKRAANMDRFALAALYNGHVILSQLGDHDTADPLLRRAMRIDTPLVLQWNKQIARESNLLPCRQVTQGNRHVMQATTNVAPLWKSTLARHVTADGVLVPYSGLVTGRAGLTIMRPLGAVGALMVIVFWLSSSFLPTSRRCHACGEIAEPGARLDLDDGPLCKECILADIRRGFVDAKEKWFQEKATRASAAGRARWARIITWFLPGAGHLLRGAAVRGMIFLAGILGCGFGAFALHQIVANPGAPLTVSPARLTVFGIIAALFWIVAVIDAHTGGNSA
jgi:tetratricopeptide (TPR) repeat protein